MPPGFVQDARKYSNVDSLKDVRVVFKSFSRRAIHITQGKPGYYDVACCLMVLDNEDDWVQMTKSISNPCPRQARAACGSIEK